MFPYEILNWVVISSEKNWRLQLTFSLGTVVLNQLLIKH